MAALRKVLLYSLLAVVVLLVVGITATIGWRPIIGPRSRPLTDRTFERTPSRMARGAYLMKGVTPCLVCHSETNLDELWNPKPGTEGSGQPWPEPALSFMVVPNITPDPETGAGTWSDDAIARAVREGIGHDGRTLFPLMPYGKFRVMSDEDLASVITYLRSMPPVKKARPRSEIPFPVNRLINTEPAPVTGPVPEPDGSTPEKRGHYLVTIAGCGDCHTPLDSRNQPIAGMDLAGGSTIELPKRSPVTSANLTPSPNGIPYYTEELFLETLRTGKVRGRQLSDVMPWRFYRNMTDEDLRAVFAYLQSLAPVDHYVDNALPATDCVRCGHSHGGGERNKKAA
jgi:mono/diheme cytochrome c family protein